MTTIDKVTTSLQYKQETIKLNLSLHRLRENKVDHGRWHTLQPHDRRSEGTRVSAPEKDKPPRRHKSGGSFIIKHMYWQDLFGVTEWIPWPPRSRRQCGRARWRGSWRAPPWPAAAPPPPPLSTAACQPPMPPRLQVSKKITRGKAESV